MNPTLRKYIMFSMCPLVVFMIFATKCEIFHYFEQKSVKYLTNFCFSRKITLKNK